jgi:hypothetical protein
VVEPGGAGLVGGRHRPAGRVRAVEYREHVRRGGLHAERHPGVAGRADAREELR